MIFYFKIGESIFSFWVVVLFFRGDSVLEYFGENEGEVLGLGGNGVMID